MPGGQFELRFYTPHQLLRRYIQSYWIVRAKTAPPVVRYLHPDGGSGLTLSYGDPTVIDGLLRSPGISARDQMLAPVELRLGGTTKIVGVRFHPGGAYGLFRTAKLAAALEEAPETKVLYEQVGEAAISERVVEILDGWLNAFRTEGRMSSATVQTIRDIAYHHGSMPVERIARNAGVSARHLERLFREEVGYSPKQLSRILRVRHAKRLIATGAAKDLSRTAYLLGYADQPHFNREFRSIIGIPPARYRKLAGVNMPDSGGSSVLTGSRVPAGGWST